MKKQEEKELKKIFNNVFRSLKSIVINANKIKELDKRVSLTQYSIEIILAAVTSSNRLRLGTLQILIQDFWDKHKQLHSFKNPTLAAFDPNKDKKPDYVG